MEALLHGARSDENASLWNGGRPMKTSPAAINHALPSAQLARCPFEPLPTGMSRQLRYSLSHIVARFAQWVFLRAR